MRIRAKTFRPALPSPKPRTLSLVCEPSVYFAECEGFIKIGWATNPGNRVFHHQTGNPFPVRLLATMPGGRSEEQQIHAAFCHLRHRGEWFSSAPDLLAYIEQVKAADVEMVQLAAAMELVEQRQAKKSHEKSQVNRDVSETVTKSAS